MTGRTVCLGGTFNVLHDGHKLLLRTAFENAGSVIIGLTSDRMASENRKVVRPYGSRYRSLRRYCSRFGVEFTIYMIEDPYGPSIEMSSIDALAVTADNSFRGREINSIRVKRGMKPLRVISVPIIRAADGLPLSSTRILNGECDRHGNVLSELRIGIGSSNPSKIEGVERAFRRYRKDFARPVFLPVETESGVPEQPLDSMQTARGALNRAVQSLEGNDMGVGIEAGLTRSGIRGVFLDVQFCVLIDSSGEMTYGQGIGFQYPSSVTDALTSGKGTAGALISELSGIPDVGRKTGAIGYLSRGVLSRSHITEDAVIAALLPRVNRELYVRHAHDSVK
jgi:inosine/xanthosine triphosphatase